MCCYNFYGRWGLPRVSAIIPTYNAPHFLVQSVESVLAQDYGDYELIVIDDGSGPETRAALEPYMQRIRYIYQDNAGPSAARNRGIKESSGEFLAFLDHDDLWLPEKLKSQVEFMDAHQEFPLTYHAVDYFADDRELDLPQREGPSGDVLAKLFKRIFLITLAVMCRRECFEKCGCFNEELRFAQDYDMWLRMALNYDFGYIDKMLGRYRFHEANLSWENDIRHFTEKMTIRESIYAGKTAAERIPRKLYRREIASVTFKLAKMHLAKDEVEKSREMIAKSIRHRPVEPRRWLFWLRARFA
jgi:glycosyltransferase involved in cell wall biosynthesis